MKKISPYFIKKYGLIDSTNLLALREFDNLSDGAVITAEKQSAGRGRMDRIWLSEGKGLYFTVVIKDCDSPEKCSSFSHLLAVSICSALKKYGLNPSIKWPNDVLCGGGKICGILVQAAVNEKGLVGVVLGAGINVAQDELDFVNIMYPARSLKMLTDKNFDKNKLLTDVLDEFYSRKQDFVKNGFAFFKKEYLSFCRYIGKEITINIHDRKIKGIAENINEQGCIVINSGGKLLTVTAGDVLL